MKKRTIGLISALLAVLLLAGCGSVQQAAESIAEAVSGSSFSGARRSPDMVHFDDMEYVRPDLDALRADIDVAEEALDEGVPFLKTRRLLDSCFDDYYSYYTMYTLADIRSCQNLTDEYYAAEYNWCAENYAVVQQLAEQFRQENGSLICAELLGLKKPEGTHEPEARTAAYYQKRPCAMMVETAARLFARYLSESKQAGE